MVPSSGLACAPSVTYISRASGRTPRLPGNQDATSKEHLQRPGPGHSALRLRSYQVPNAVGLRPASVKRTLSFTREPRGTWRGTTKPTSARERVFHKSAFPRESRLWNAGGPPGAWIWGGRARVGLGRGAAGRTTKGMVWEAEGTACAKALSRRPQLPLCPPRDLVGLWEDSPGPATQQLQLEGWVQGPVRWTFSSTAVGSAHVSASGLANVPLKPHSVVLVWVWVFLFKEKQLQGQERMAVLEKLPMPRARLIHSGPGPRATPSRRPGGGRAAPSSRMPTLPSQASGSGRHDIELPSAFSDEGLPPSPDQSLSVLCGAQLARPG